MIYLCKFLNLNSSCPLNKDQITFVTTLSQCPARQFYIYSRMSSLVGELMIERMNVYNRLGLVS